VEGEGPARRLWKCRMTFANRLAAAIGKGRERPGCMHGGQGAENRRLGICPLIAHETSATRADYFFRNYPIYFERLLVHSAATSTGTRISPRPLEGVVPVSQEEGF
jgi:hypothetical protein